MIDLFLACFVSVAGGIIIGVAIVETDWNEKLFKLMKKIRKEKDEE